MVAGNLSGFPVYSNSYACQPEFVRWKRTHRKARVAKKWRKKYGSVTRCKGVVFQMKNAFYTCPCGMTILQRIATAA